MHWCTGALVNSFFIRSDFLYKSIEISSKFLKYHMIYYLAFNISIQNMMITANITPTVARMGTADGSP